jgi:hypothetical protein
VADSQGRRVSIPTMCRALQRLELPRQKRRSTPVNATCRASSRHGPTIMR